MNWADLNLIPALPEITLLVALCAVLLIDLFVSDDNRWVTYVLSLITLVVVGVVQFVTLPSLEGSQYTFSDMFVADTFSQTMKFAMYAAMFLVFVYSHDYIKARGLYKGEFYTLSLFALLGMNVMVSATHFLTLYIGLELMSLALYALIALQRDKPQASEAAIKYFVLGALASGLLLYGISMIYGATGSLYLANVFEMVYAGSANASLLLLGIVFIVAGLAFKLGTVPFHMWVPDVYQGAPTAVTMIVGSAPKIAAFGFMFRILVMGLGGAYGSWMPMLGLLAVASLLVGNLAAIMQTNLKRMLAYSTISHMGFILLAFMGKAPGFEAALFYTISYVLMALVGFGVLIALSNKGFECENLNDIKGLNQKNAWYAFLMLLAMFSMAGIPPLLGFYAKFAVLKALMGQGDLLAASGDFAQANAYYGLTVYAVIMSLIGAFYYLRVVKAMYFDNQEHQEEITFSFSGKVLLSINALLLLVMGILPDSLMSWCINAFTGT